jgi:uncharacterized membrane protein HdeD (DUF308 family)
LIFPGATIDIFAALFGCILVASGLFGFVRSITNKNRATSIGIITSVIAFIVGIYILLYPVIFVEFLVFLFAIVLLIKSIITLQLSGGATGSSSAWLVVSGILGVVAAIFLFVAPAIGSIAILILLGAYAILVGVLGIVDLVNIRGKFSKMVKK